MREIHMPCVLDIARVAAGPFAPPQEPEDGSGILVTSFCILDCVRPESQMHAKNCCSTGGEEPCHLHTKCSLMRHGFFFLA